MPLNMKVFICSDKNLIDHNDTYLPAGKYYFNIEKGNNSYLVFRVLSRRLNWKEVPKFF